MFYITSSPQPLVKFFIPNMDNKQHIPLARNLDVPITVLDFEMNCHYILIAAVWNNYYYFPSTDEETNEWTSRGLFL